MSKHNGKAEFDFKGKKLALVFDYEGLSEIVDKFGGTIFSDIMQASPRTIAEMVAIGLRRNHPDVTAADIMKESPPIRKLQIAIDRAYAYSLYGPEDAEKIIAAVEKPDLPKKN